MSQEPQPKGIQRYGALWASGTTDIAIERECIRKGGKWKGKQGQECGEGLFNHYKNLQSLLWPEKKWHRWNLLALEEFTQNRTIGIMGPANSGKTREAADYGLSTYFCFPNSTTILVSSTDTRSLELRIWGEIKKQWLKAKRVFPAFPGYMTESKQLITTDPKGSEARDFRNGLIGIPCIVGGQYVGLGKYVGIKNDNVILLADEAQFMNRVFVDAISNLNKNPRFQCLSLGNPKDPMDALGIICEPSVDIGGWEGLDQTEKTKTWPTRFPGGVCIQLVGTDSPNFDVPEGEPPPFPFLIKRKDIDQDLAYYGKDSLQFTMMNLGMMPKSGVARRVITLMLCETHGAMEEPVWDGTPVLKIGCLDAAYGSIGGDRCVFGELHLGYDKFGKQILAVNGSFVNVPVSGKKEKTPEDQIAEYVMNLCKERGIRPENLFYDSTGRGTLGTAFARVWSPAVNPIEFGGRPSERLVFPDKKILCSEYYSKFVSELWYSVRYAIESEQMRSIPREIIDEGCMREWKVVQGNKIEVEPKEITKTRMGRSPDLFDCLVVGVEGARRRGFTISKLGNLRARQESLDWLRKLSDKQRNLEKSKQLTYAS